MIADAHTAVTVHAVLEWLAMGAGAAYYRTLRRRSGGGGLLDGANFAVLSGCLLGAGVGNKAVFWLEMPRHWPAQGGLMAFLSGGQSMVGGLLGGLLGVELAKALVGVRQSTGDFFVFPILLGLIIGRVGCFLAGMHDDTYGVVTALPWGVDFGDGLARHPTQLYEIGFAACLWLSLQRLRDRCALQPGLLFKTMLSAYLLWRLLVDGLKPVPYAYPLGLSGIQWVCALALAAYGTLTAHQWRRLE